MLASLILLPAILALAAVILPGYRARDLLLPLGGACHLGLAFYLCIIAPPVSEGWLGIDPLARVVLLVTSLLFMGCSIYAVAYLALRRERGNRQMVACLLLFLSVMTLAVTARHLGVLWIAVEATTLASAPLIYYNRNRLSIEATWKYLLICSVGIALAMLGLLFVAYAALSGGEPLSLQIDHLLATGPRLDPAWLRAGFVFLLVGFGTKMGLAPLHSWKPDAYGEAPGLVGALLAGGLTSVAFLAILRGVQIMSAAGDMAMARRMLLILGLLSLLLAAVSMVRQRDIKRMLAYSSVEHMGLLAVGVGIGGLATFGALLHLINNALTKGCLFLSAGNIQRAYASKRFEDIHGAMAHLPFSGGLFLAGFLAITGSPPFGPFLSELTILRGMFAGGHTLVAGSVLALLAVIFVAMGTTVLSVVQGEPPAGNPPFRDGLLLIAPPLGFILCILLLGLYLPEPLRSLLQEAAAQLETGS